MPARRSARTQQQDKGIGWDKTVQFVCHVRTARKKAIEAAATETLSLLQGLSPSRCPGGPLAEQGGVFWIKVPRVSLDKAIDRFPRLGYTRAVDQLEPVQPAASSSHKGMIRWRKQYFRLSRVYAEDDALLREQAPDRREFAILDSKGTARKVRGYRGDGTRSGRRALPVCDARLLVNMAGPAKVDAVRFLDPFAGAGGIAVEALKSGFSVFTVDIDPVVSPGLKGLGACHCVANTCILPFADSSFHAVATEPPYHEELGSLVAASLGEIARVLAPGGKAVVFGADRHADLVKLRAAALGLSAVFESPIDRKGTACKVFVWQKAGQVE